MPGRRNSRTSGLVAEDFFAEEREWESLAMSAEEESYASGLGVSPAKNEMREKENGRADHVGPPVSKDTPPCVITNGAACRPLACPLPACYPAYLSDVLASGVPVAVFVPVSAAAGRVSA